MTNCYKRMEHMQSYGTDKWNRGDEQMKPIIINMDEMSDSKEVYESKPGRAGLIFLYSILALVVIAIIWMVFGKIDEVVKSEGIIRPNSDISTVVNQTEGEITEVNVEDGQAVQKGDCLYQVDCSTQESQKDYLEHQIDDLSDKKHCLEVYKRSVKADTNLLADTGDEEEYHIQFESYFISYQNAIHAADYTTKANQYQTKSSKRQLLKKQSRLSYYEKLNDSISQRRNLFTDAGEESEFYTLYQKYVSGYQKKKHRNFSRNRPELVLKNGPKLLRICPEIGANFAEIFFKFDAKFILKLSLILSVFGSILVSKTGFCPKM